MAITTVTTPDSLTPIYALDSLLYEWKEAFSITGNTNASGNLSLTVGASATAEITAGDYVYVSVLENVDNVDSPVALVNSVAATSITLNTNFLTIASGGEIRLMRPLSFLIQTGESGTNQPLRTTYTGNITPNPKGLYTLDAYHAALSRLGFNTPPTEADPDRNHCVEIRAYQADETPPSFITGLKQNNGTLAALPIVYNDFRNVISSTLGGQYATHIEDEPTQNVDPVTAQVFRFFANKLITINFNTSLSESITTISPALPAYAKLITSNSGQTYDGFTLDLTQVNASETNGLDITFTQNNGGVVTEYGFEFSFYPFLQSRNLCNSKSLLLYWWSPNGGWVSYSFELLKEFSLSENESILAENQGQRIATAYEKQREAVTVYAPPEGQTVLDYLNTMYQSTEIYVLEGAVTDPANFKRYFIDAGSVSLKRTNQYRPNENRFSVTLIKSEENRPINQD